MMLVKFETGALKQMKPLAKKRCSRCPEYRFAVYDKQRGHINACHYPSCNNIAKSFTLKPDIRALEAIRQLLT